MPFSEKVLLQAAERGAEMMPKLIDAINDLAQDEVGTLAACLATGALYSSFIQTFGGKSRQQVAEAAREAGKLFREQMDRALKPIGPHEKCPKCGETPTEASARWAKIESAPNYDPEGAPTPCDHKP